MLLLFFSSPYPQSQSHLACTLLCLQLYSDASSYRKMSARTCPTGTKRPRVLDDDDYVCPTDLPCSIGHGDAARADQHPGFAPCSQGPLPYKQNLQSSVHLRMVSLQTEVLQNRRIRGVVPYLDSDSKVRRSFVAFSKRAPLCVCGTYCCPKSCVNMTKILIIL
jgi:hypothetical protein